jgi:hypothetical protein
MIVVPSCGWVATIDRGGRCRWGPKRRSRNFCSRAPSPLFAFGIVIVRLLAPLSSMVGTVQWIQKREGASLKGDWIRGSSCCLLGTVAGRAVFGA